MTTPGAGRVPRPRDPKAELAAEPDVPLRISTRAGDDYYVVALTGEIDIASAPLLRSTVQALLADGRGQILVDLEGVTFLDAAGLSALIATTEAASVAGGTLQVTPHPRLMQLLTVTGETHRVHVRTLQTRSVSTWSDA